MKNAVIFHGSGGTPDHFWHPYVKRELEGVGYEVWVPQLPDADTPRLERWLPVALEGNVYDEETVLIGHSMGCPLILSILEKLETKVKLVILVAAFSEAEDVGSEHEPFLQESYDWEVIKNKAEKIVIINSVDDPYGCNDKAGRKIFDKVGGELIIRSNQGHMDSEKFNQPYKEFPLLVYLVKTFA